MDYGFVGIELDLILAKKAEKGNRIEINEISGDKSPYSEPEKYTIKNVRLVRIEDNV